MISAAFTCPPPSPRAKQELADPQCGMAGEGVVYSASTTLRLSRVLANPCMGPFHKNNVPWNLSSVHLYIKASKIHFMYK